MISEQEIHAIGKAIAEAARAKHARQERCQRYALVFVAVDEWLDHHPHGRVEILGDPNGRICHLIDFDEAAADQYVSRTGLGQDTLSAMLAALEVE